MKEMAIKLTKLIIFYFFYCIFLGNFAESVPRIDARHKQCSGHADSYHTEPYSNEFRCYGMLDVIESGLNKTKLNSNNYEFDCWCFQLFRYRFECGQVSIKTANPCIKPNLTIVGAVNTIIYVLDPVDADMCLYFRAPLPEKSKNSSIEATIFLDLTCAELRDVFDGLRSAVSYNNLAHPGCAKGAKDRYELAKQKSMCGIDPVADRFCIPTDKGCVMRDAPLECSNATDLMLTFSIAGTVSSSIQF